MSPEPIKQVPTREVQAHEVTISVPHREIGRGKRVPEELKTSVVELILQGIPQKTVARNLQLRPETVSNIWKKYLREASEQRVQNTQVAFEELIQRLNRNAFDAQALFYDNVDEKPAIALKALATEREAIAQMAKLGVERDGAPELAAKVSSAQATAVAQLIREVVAESGLTNEDRKTLISAFSTRLRDMAAIEAADEDIIDAEVVEEDGTEF